MTSRETRTETSQMVDVSTFDLGDFEEVHGAKAFAPDSGYQIDETLSETVFGPRLSSSNILQRTPGIALSRVSFKEGR